MSSSTFKGFGGIELAAHVFGDRSDPAVLLLHGGGQSKGSWRGAGEALAAAGRFAVSLDLRGHGSSAWAADGRYDLDAFIGDLHAVLGALPSAL